MSANTLTTVTYDLDASDLVETLAEIVYAMRKGSTVFIQPVIGPEDPEERFSRIKIDNISELIVVLDTFVDVRVYVEKNLERDHKYRFVQEDK